MVDRSEVLILGPFQEPFNFLSSVTVSSSEADGTNKSVPAEHTQPVALNMQRLDYVFGGQDHPDVSVLLGSSLMTDLNPALIARRITSE